MMKDSLKRTGLKLLVLPCLLFPLAMAGVGCDSNDGPAAGQSHELRLIFSRESSPRPLDSIPPSSVSPAGSLSPSCFS